MIFERIDATRNLLLQASQYVQQHPKRVATALGFALLGASGLSFAVSELVPDSASITPVIVVETVTPLSLGIASESAATWALPLYRSDTTRSTDTAESLLKRLGISDADAASFLRTDPLAQQTLLGRAGRSVKAEASATHRLQSLTARWSTDSVDTFKRLKIQKTASGYTSTLETLPMSASTRLAGGVIASSLFAATDDANIPDSVAIQMAEIFSGDIDFHRSLRKGDRFSVVYETLEGDGEPLRAGRVLSAEFVNNGKPHSAIWFQEPASQGAYYTLEGDSMRHAFLASPLEFSRVTSGFKMRFHPILRTWRAHNGIDYAASTGTPVRTVGDGVVSFAGVQNGFGNVIMVQHRDQHVTVYAHLSRINVRVGQSVSQGQFIGAVGATGWATGPHLHFELRVNGKFVDPLTVVGKSKSAPIAAAQRPAFAQHAAQARAQLAAATDVASNFQ